MFIRRGLVFDKHVHVTVSAGGGFQAVKHVAEIRTQVILDKAAGLQLQRAQITDSLQLCRQVQQHKIPRGIGMRQKLFESQIMRRWGLFHEAIVTCSVPGSLSQRWGLSVPRAAELADDVDAGIRFVLPLT